jgi:hypothetical protein
LVKEEKKHNYETYRIVFIVDIVVDNHFLKTMFFHSIGRQPQNTSPIVVVVIDGTFGHCH